MQTELGGLGHRPVRSRLALTCVGHTTDHVVGLGFQWASAHEASAWWTHDECTIDHKLVHYGLGLCGACAHGSWYTECTQGKRGESARLLPLLSARHGSAKGSLMRKSRGEAR